MSGTVWSIVLIFNELRYPPWNLSEISTQSIFQPSFKNKWWWTNTRLTVIWRRRNVLNWIVSMAVAGGPAAIWHQDISNRHGEIGQLHIYRYAILFQSCPVVSAALRKNSNIAQCKRITESLKLCVFARALVRQLAWYRQATNHYIITWTNIDDASWPHIASLGPNKLTICGLVTPCSDIGLGKSCLTAPSHYLNQCWPHKIPQPLAITYLRFCSTPGANGSNTHESWIYIIKPCV